ncbi:T-cell receptor alpha chain V region PHDS58 [Tupaia chinensis]|nr:T-cell receptor alpha chain V region PHDS58 [Tupaia chinensis]
MGSSAGPVIVLFLMFESRFLQPASFLFLETFRKESAGFYCSAMLLVLIPVLGIHFVLRDARAQSVTQPDSHVTVSEKASLELRCNYSGTSTPYLFWYVQYPGQGLQLLLKYYSGDTLVKGSNGFEAEFKKSDSSFNLKKSSVHWTDTAEYFCVLRDTVPGAAGGAAHKPPMAVGCQTQDLSVVLRRSLVI